MGAASNFKNRIENHTNGITDLPGVDHLGQLTPFQNQVLDFAHRKEEEKKQEQREEAKQGRGSSPPSNARSSSGSTQQTNSQEETVRYINKELNPEHEVH